MTEQEYRKLTRVSYSKLSGLYKSPASLIQERETWNDGIMFGSMVDMILFDGLEVFEAGYAVVPKKPAATIVKLVDEIINLNNPLGTITNFPKLEDIEPVIHEACKNTAFLQSRKPETRFKEVLKKANDYYSAKAQTVGKVLVSQEDYDKALVAVNTLQTHPFTSNYLVPQDGIDIIFQPKILWEYETLECKSMFDILMVNHNTKTVQIVDLKTTSKSQYAFKSAAGEWHYHLQAAFYTDALHYAIENGVKINGVTIPEDYTVLNFMFIVSSQNSPTKPLIWACTDKFIKVGRSGGNLFWGETKGYKQLVVDYLWHLATGLYDYPKEVYENKGIMLLNTMDE